MLSNISRNVLQKLEVPIIDGNNCTAVYKDRGGILDPNAQLCAGGEQGKDSCNGDSGSGLMREELVDNTGCPVPCFPFRWKLLGVVSFGPRLIRS